MFQRYRETKKLMDNISFKPFCRLPTPKTPSNNLKRANFIIGRYIGIVVILFNPRIYKREQSEKVKCMFFIKLESSNNSLKATCRLEVNTIRSRIIYKEI